MARILIVDAAPDSMKHVVNALREQQHEMVQSNNAYSAIELVDSDMPDCIILDNKLPQLDGIAVCRKIRENPDSKHIPILLICDTKNPSEIQAAINAGVNEFITKPINLPLFKNRVQNLIIQSRDFQSRETTQRLLHEAKQTERMATIGIMASGIAHEFNNLNTIILGNVELLIRKQDLPVQVSERISNIHEAVLRSKHATSNLLNFTRGDSNPTDIVNLQDVINSTISMARGSFVQNAIQVRTDIPPQPILVHGNADELSQVLLNFIINSMHAMNGCEEKVLTISLDADLEEEEACISIADTGSGIPDDKIKHLFHPYYAKNNNENHALSKFAGSPLGLSISETIIENHCGNIQVESSVGIGTTFLIALPTCTESHYYKSPLPLDTGITSLTGKSILIADDEAHIRELLCDLLEEQGCDITTANNGKQALAKLQNKIYDVIILDWQMPILDGAGVIDFIEGLPIEQQAPIVVVSGWHSNGLLSDHQKRFAPVTISKPFKSDDMIEAVKEALKAAHKNRIR